MENQESNIIGDSRADAEGEKTRLENYNFHRSAIQATVAWEFEMWRRHEQATWEQDMIKAEEELRQRLTNDLLSLESNFETELERKKDSLQHKNKQLNDLVLLIGRETAELERLEAQIAEAQDASALEYERVREQIAKKVALVKADVAKKVAAEKSRSREMAERAAFFRNQWVQQEQRLRQDTLVFDERKRQLVLEDDAELKADLARMKNEIAQHQRKLDQLQPLRSQLQQQYYDLCMNITRMEELLSLQI